MTGSRQDERAAAHEWRQGPRSLGALVHQRLPATGSLTLRYRAARVGAPTLPLVTSTAGKGVRRGVLRSRGACSRSHVTNHLARVRHGALDCDVPGDVAGAHGGRCVGVGPPWRDVPRLNVTSRLSGHGSVVDGPPWGCRSPRRRAIRARRASRRRPVGHVPGQGASGVPSCRSTTPGSSDTPSGRRSSSRGARRGCSTSPAPPRRSE